MLTSGTRKSQTTASKRSDDRSDRSREAYSGDRYFATAYGTESPR
jgi:hypothetical protein